MAWVVNKVTLEELTRAAAELDWPSVVPLTGALVLALFFWDSFCLRWLFSGPHRQAPGYRAVLHARGRSYLLTAVNYELGQGFLAWCLARALGIPLLFSLGLFVLLALHDMVVLLGLGLAGSLASADPLAGDIRLICLAGLGALLVLAMLGWLAPARWKVRFNRTKLATGLGSWTGRRSLQLLLLRTSYYGIILGYAVAGLGICGIGLDRPHRFWVICSVIPLVLLADGLPISVSGLGTRETALIYLLQPEQPGVVLAFSLVWSFGLMLGRLAIGLSHWWFPSR